MVYIPLNDNLFDHPKTQKAARRLGITEVQLVGHLSALWLWCLSYAEEGDLSDYEPEEVAAAARWRDDPDAFITALVECGRKGGHGFLESSEPGILVVHDYDEYVGKLIDRRKANAERMRQSRAGHASPPAAAPKSPTVSQKSPAPPAPHASAPAPPRTQITHTEEGCAAPTDNDTNTHFSVQNMCETRVELDKQSKEQQSKDKQSEDNNNQEERSAEERSAEERSVAVAPPLPDAPPVDSECRVVVASSLCDLGVSEIVAEDLCRRRTCQQITDQIDWLPHRIAEREGTTKHVRDPAALLVKAIEDGYAAPATVQRLRAEAQQRKRQAEAQEKDQQRTVATKRAEDANRGQLEQAWKALSEEARSDLTEQITTRFREMYPVETYKHGPVLSEGQWEKMPPGPRGLWRKLRDAAIVERQETENAE